LVFVGDILHRYHLLGLINWQYGAEQTAKNNTK
jgi:hypothetical protein